MRLSWGRLALFLWLLAGLALLAGCGGGGGGGAAPGGSPLVAGPLGSGRLSLVVDYSSRSNRGLTVQGDEVLLQLSGVPARALIRLVDDAGESVVQDTVVEFDPADPTARRTVTITGIPFGTWFLEITTFDDQGQVIAFFRTRVTIGPGTATSVTAVSVTGLQIIPAAAQVPAGLTTQLTVIGLLSNGSTRNLTEEVEFSVSDPGLAAVDPQGRGVLSGLAPGPVVVTASYGPLVGTLALTVTDAVITSLAVDPPTASQPAGFAAQYTATATLSDLTTRDVTEEVSWSVSDGATAGVSNTPGTRGLATGLQPGTVTVTALDPVTLTSGSASFTVTDAVLQSLAVEPATDQVPKGLTKPFRAMGTFSDATVRDVTTQVLWTSGAVAVATVSNAAGSEGVATGVETGTATLQAEHGPTGLTATATLDVTPAVLQSLAVTPQGVSLPDGRAQQYTATGTFSDGQVLDLTDTVTWTSSDPAVATVTNAGAFVPGAGGPGVKRVAGGFATAVDPGQAVIAALDATSGLSSTTTLTVTAAVLDSIAVTPADDSVPAGLTKQYTATGFFSDGSTRDLTATATWASSDGAVASISNAAGSKGLATGVAAGGPVTITATDPGTLVQGGTPLTVTAALLVSLQVAPDGQAVPVGRTLQLTATGLFTDGSTQDLTEQASWDSTDGAIADVSNVAGNRGLVTAVAVGGAIIKGDVGGIRNAVTVTVTPAVLETVAIAPRPASVPRGLSQQFTATGTFSDGTVVDLTNTVVWSSFDLSIAFFSTNPGEEGLAVGVQEGSVTVRARDNASGFEDTTTLTVTAATLQSLAVTPVPPVPDPGPTPPPGVPVPKGARQPFVATGNFSDGSTRDVTADAFWTTDDGGIATVENAPGFPGRLTGVSEGDTNVNATLGGVTGSTLVSVIPAVPVGVQVTPDGVLLPKGRRQVYRADALMSDGTLVDVTNTATWSTADPGIAVVGDGQDVPFHEITGVGEGSTFVRADFQGFSHQVNLTVTPPVIAFISIQPRNPDPVVFDGFAGMQFTAQVILSDGTFINNGEELLEWSTGDPGVATVSNTPGSKGFVSGVSDGQTTLNARDPNNAAVFDIINIFSSMPSS